MTCVLVENQARIIHAQAGVISDELGEDNTESQLQSLVQLCLAMGHTWKGVVTRLSADPEQVDHRDLGIKLRDIANVSVTAFDALVARVERSGMEIDGIADVKLCRHEVQKIAAWIATWPGSDGSAAERRREAREAVARGEQRPVEEFLEELQEAN